MFWCVKCSKGLHAVAASQMYSGLNRKAMVYWQHCTRPTCKTGRKSSPSASKYAEGLCESMRAATVLYKGLFFKIIRCEKKAVSNHCTNVPMDAILKCMHNSTNTINMSTHLQPVLSLKNLFSVTNNFLGIIKNQEIN